ncbi:MAG TPA: hypothetical protein PKV21_06395 [bacterium]|nr:hypothetical protein [bacterium]HOM27118.1 hypothetical protein [bacterium]
MGKTILKTEFFIEVFKDGFKILKSKQRILSIFILLFIFENFFSILISYFYHYKPLISTSFLKFFTEIEFRSLWITFKKEFISSTGQLPFSICSVSVPYNITVILFLVFSFKIWRKISDDFPEDLKTTKIFLLKNFFPFLIACLITLSPFYIKKLSQLIFNKNLIVWSFITIPFALYSFTLLSAVLNSYIFYLLSSEEEKEIFDFHALKFTRSIFLIKLILLAPLYIFSIFLPYTKFTIYMAKFFHAILIFFFFVPPLIVIENLEWQQAFKRNFEFLRDYRVLIIIYFFIIYCLNFLLKFIQLFFNSKLLDLIYVFINIPFEFYIVAVTCVFLKKIGSYF